MPTVATRFDGVTTFTYDSADTSNSALNGAQMDLVFADCGSGDVIEFMPGIKYEQNSTGGSSTLDSTVADINDLTIRSMTKGEKYIIVPSYSSGSPLNYDRLWWFHDCDRIYIEDAKFDGRYHNGRFFPNSTGSGSGLHLDSGSGICQVVDCEVIGIDGTSGGYGIRCVSVEDIRILRSKAEMCGYLGFHTALCTEVLFEDLEARNMLPGGRAFGDSTTHATHVTNNITYRRLIGVADSPNRSTAINISEEGGATVTNFLAEDVVITQVRDGAGVSWDDGLSHPIIKFEGVVNATWRRLKVSHGIVINGGGAAKSLNIGSEGGNVHQSVILDDCKFDCSVDFQNQPIQNLEIRGCEFCIYTVTLNDAAITVSDVTNMTITSNDDGKPTKIHTHLDAPRRFVKINDQDFDENNDTWIINNIEFRQTNPDSQWTYLFETGVSGGALNPPVYTDGGAIDEVNTLGSFDHSDQSLQVSHNGTGRAYFCRYHNGSSWLYGHEFT